MKMKFWVKREIRRTPPHPVPSLDPLLTMQANGYFNAPARDRTCNKTCATSEDSDQTARPRSLIRVFTDHICLLQPPSYPNKDEREPLPYCVDEQADLESLLITQV